MEYFCWRQSENANTCPSAFSLSGLASECCLSHGVFWWSLSRSSRHTYYIVHIRTWNCHFLWNLLNLVEAHVPWHTSLLFSFFTILIMVHPVNHQSSKFFRKKTGTKLWVCIYPQTTQDKWQLFKTVSLQWQFCGYGYLPLLKYSTRNDQCQLSLWQTSEMLSSSQLS